MREACVSFGASGAINTGCCPHCGNSPHLAGICPRISAIEYHENGTIKRVEYHPVAAQVGLLPDLGASTPTIR